MATIKSKASKRECRADGSVAEEMKQWLLGLLVPDRTRVWIAAPMLDSSQLLSRSRECSLLTSLETCTQAAKWTDGHTHTHKQH